MLLKIIWNPSAQVDQACRFCIGIDGIDHCRFDVHAMQSYKAIHGHTWPSLHALISEVMVYIPPSSPSEHRLVRHQMLVLRRQKADLPRSSKIIQDDIG